MISQSDIILVVLASIIGFISDKTGPQKYFYNYDKTIVIVDRKYQCPEYCGVDHCHSVYFKNKMTYGNNKMCIDESKLGKRIKKNKK